MKIRRRLQVLRDAGLLIHTSRSEPKRCGGKFTLKVTMLANTLATVFAIGTGDYASESR